MKRVLALLLVLVLVLAGCSNAPADSVTQVQPTTQEQKTTEVLIETTEVVTTEEVTTEEVKTLDFKTEQESNYDLPEMSEEATWEFRRENFGNWVAGTARVTVVSGRPLTEEELSKIDSFDFSYHPEQYKLMRYVMKYELRGVTTNSKLESWTTDMFYPGVARVQSPPGDRNVFENPPLGIGFSECLWDKMSATLELAKESEEMPENIVFTGEYLVLQTINEDFEIVFEDQAMNDPSAMPKITLPRIE